MLEKKTSPNSCRSSSSPEKVRNISLVIGVGDELPVYEAMRVLWEDYARSFPGNINLFFVRADAEVEFGHVKLRGDLALVGIKKHIGSGHQISSYAETGYWSEYESCFANSRNAIFFRWLLESGAAGEIIVQSTLTSFIDMKFLAAYCELLPSERLYGGTVKCGYMTPINRYYSFVSGANTYMSRDVFEIYIDRMATSVGLTSVPNDVLAGYLLRDLPRHATPFFTFDLRDLAELVYVKPVLEFVKNSGFFHFRIKSSVKSQVLRKEIDSKVWLEAYHNSALACDTERAVRLASRYSATLNPDLLGANLDGFAHKERYFRSPSVPMFFSQLLSQIGVLQ